MSEFDKILQIYPKKTPNGRRLHSDKEYCKKKYESMLAKEPNLEEKITKAIKIELAERLMNRSMNFLRMLKTYINQRGWEEYLDNENESIPEEKHGHKLI